MNQTENQAQPVKAEKIKNLAMQNEKQVKSPEAIISENLGHKSMRSYTYHDMVEMMKIYHAQFTNVEPVQESLEEIAHSLFDHNKSPYENCLMGLAYQRSIEKDGWIAVEDELPNETGHYLVR